MTTDTKKLAEFAAEFLGMTQDKSRMWWPNELPIERCDDDEIKYVLFECVETSPILAHFGKREMEKRGFEFDARSRFEPTKNLNQKRVHYFYIYQKGKFNVFKQAEDENEYKALWMAIEATGEK